MRKIEKNMLRAIWKAIDGNGAQFSWHQDNTSVYVLPANPHIESDRYVVLVELHGNRIARISCTVGDIARRVEVNNAAWETPTTKSRINAICGEFGRGQVYQKGHRWFYVTKSGNVFPFPCNDWFHAF